MKRIICILLSIALITLSGCTATAPQGDAPVIASSFYPVYIFTKNLVEGTDIEVRCMAQQNIGCLHDYTLTAGDVKLLNDADILVINGAEMESFIEDAYRLAENLYVIDSSVGVQLLCEEEEHHTEHEEGHDEEHHHHNSHIWLSVENAKKQVENIKNELVKQLPEYEESLEANFSRYIASLDELSAKRDSLAKEIQGSEMISFHGAYEYMAKEIGLSIVATVENEDGGEPSARLLAELCDRVRAEEIKGLIIEPQYELSGADIVSAETGVKVIVLNPVTQGEDTLDAYQNIMTENYQIIAKAVRE